MSKDKVGARSAAAYKLLIELASAAGGHSAQLRGHWAYPVLRPLIGDAVDTAALMRGWTELMRVRASIEAGAVAPSTILRKLAASGPDNALSRALRALGRIERTLFTLQWLSDPALRQRSHAGSTSTGPSSSFGHRASSFLTSYSPTSYRLAGSTSRSPATTTGTPPDPPGRGRCGLFLGRSHCKPLSVQF